MSDYLHGTYVLGAGEALAPPAAPATGLTKSQRDYIVRGGVVGMAVGAAALGVGGALLWPHAKVLAALFMGAVGVPLGGATGMVVAASRVRGVV